MRQLPDTRTLQSPRRSPLSRCIRHPGRSMFRADCASCSAVSTRRMRATWSAFRPRVSSRSWNLRSPLCVNLMPINIPCNVSRCKTRLTTIRRTAPPGFRSRFDEPNPGGFFMPLGAAYFVPQGQRGGRGIKKRGGGAPPLSLNSFVLLGLPLLFGFHNDDTEKSGEDDSDPPPKRGFPGAPIAALRGSASIPAPGGRYRRYLSLREGSEKTPRRGVERRRNGPMKWRVAPMAHSTF